MPMPDIDNLLAVTLAFLIVTVSPGPANLATATVAMRSGRRDSLLFGAGLSGGLAFWGVIAATGMGTVLRGSEILLIGLKILGGLYLLWLGFQSARAAMQGDESKPVAPREGRWFLRGLALNLSNPKAVFAWMAALSMGMGSGAESGFVVTATAICMGVGFANYALYALVFSLPGVMAGYRRCSRWINGTVAGLFAWAGLSLMHSALTR